MAVRPTPQEGTAFETIADLRAWLTANHDAAPELWVRICKKGSDVPSVTWTDCVIEALAFGWIDGQKASLDDRAYLQRLTPGRSGSSWSKTNREHAERLIAEGRMTPAGLAEVEAARGDGRWDDAYAGQADMAIPQDFLDALEALPEAKAFFATLDRKNLYPIYYRLHTAKRPKTRAKRMQAMLNQLARRERFH